MKNLMKFGKVLNSVEQKAIIGSGKRPSGGNINPFNCNFGINEACPEGMHPYIDSDTGLCKCGF